MNTLSLLKGDCLKIMEEVPNNSVNMVLCDLPYGTTDKNDWDKTLDLEILFKHYDRIITDNGIILLYAQQPFASDLINAYRKYFRYEIIWEKTKPVGFFNAKKMPLRSHENILVFYKKLPKYNPTLKDCDKKVKRPDESGVYGTRRSRSNEYTMTKTGYPRTVLKYTNVFNPQLHPTQKNVELNEFLINLFTDEGDLVVDNTMGSCSTGIACLNTNRRFLGMELNDEYFKVASERVEKKIKEKDLKDVELILHEH
jgi:site-specific DNA-methyltransferase (adenine-specific)